MNSVRKKAPGQDGPRPRGGRRERERAARRPAILAAARTLFAAQGVAAVTMRRIAEAVEYTPPVLYGHFRDKADLLRALVQEDSGLFLAALERSARIADPVERIRRMGRQYVDFALAHPHHYRLLFMTELPESELAEAGGSEPAGEDPGRRAYDLLLGAVRQCLDEGRIPRALGDAERVTQALWGAVHGVVSLWIVHGANPRCGFRPPRPTAHVLLEAALQGMLAEPRGKGSGA
jgi:AcrR family transcriptional regulator